MTNGRLVAMADSIAHCRSGNALSRQLLDAESQHTKHCIDHCWSVARLSVCIDLLVVVLLVDLYGTSTPHGMPLYTHTHTLSLSLSLWHTHQTRLHCSTTEHTIKPTHRSLQR
jgi:hypothetical protein